MNEDKSYPLHHYVKNYGRGGERKLSAMDNGKSLRFKLRSRYPSDRMLSGFHKWCGHGLYKNRTYHEFISGCSRNTNIIYIIPVQIHRTMKRKNKHNYTSNYISTTPAYRSTSLLFTGEARKVPSGCGLVTGFRDFLSTSKSIFV
jgi:hypothetical protein